MLQNMRNLNTYSSNPTTVHNINKVGQNAQFTTQTEKEKEAKKKEGYS